MAMVVLPGVYAYLMLGKKIVPIEPGGLIRGFTNRKWGC